MKPIGLYIDFPFCIARCAFCAFPIQGFQAAKADAYLDALYKEIDFAAGDPEIGARSIDSIYLGGGTPTHYAAGILSALVTHCRDRFRVAPDAEISLEAHPATLKPPDLGRLRQGGINRLSLGVQSFSDKHLLRLGRNHSAEDADRVFHAARSAGFNNIGIDLIYGLPEQDAEDWNSTLRHALSLSPEHLSIYALTVEAGTLFGKLQKAGKLALPAEAALIDDYERARIQLKAAGYRQYEISNFAQPGFACRHNRRYWNREDIVGLGLAAHSYFRQSRWENTDVLSDYIDALKTGRRPALQKKKLSDADANVDQIIFGLRMTDGISTRLLEHDAQRSRTAIRLVHAGLLEIQKDRLRLTSKGTHLADEVAVAFI